MNNFKKGDVIKNEYLCITRVIIFVNRYSYETIILENPKKIITNKCINFIDTDRYRKIGKMDSNLVLKLYGEN